MDLLAAARCCLESARLISAVRPVVLECMPDYEACVDMSLSQQFELLSALMSDYVASRQDMECDTREVGDEPLSYTDAIRSVNRFIDEAWNAVNETREKQEPLSRAMEIGVRAATYACLLAPDSAK